MGQCSAALRRAAATDSGELSVTKRTAVPCGAGALSSGTIAASVLPTNASGGIRALQPWAASAEAERGREEMRQPARLSA